MTLTTLQYIELISAVLGIMSVWLNAKTRIAGWPVGIVSVTLAGWVYFHSNLFAESGLQVFYVISGFYGWWQWTRINQNQPESQISKIRKKELIISLFIGFFLTLGMGFFFKTYTSADFPWIDSGLTAFSLMAQIWLARKYVENWLLWGMINLISVGLYAAKGLWFFLIYFAVLLILSVVGYKRWNNRLFNPTTSKTA